MECANEGCKNQLEYQNREFTDNLCQSCHEKAIPKATPEEKAAFDEMVARIDDNVALFFIGLYGSDEGFTMSGQIKTTHLRRGWHRMPVILNAAIPDDIA